MSGHAQELSPEGGNDIAGSRSLEYDMNLIGVRHNLGPMSTCGKKHGGCGEVFFVDRRFNCDERGFSYNF